MFLLLIQVDHVLHDNQIHLFYSFDYEYQYQKNIGRVIGITIKNNGNHYSAEAQLLDVSNDSILIKRTNSADEWVSITDIIHAKVLIKF